MPLVRRTRATLRSAEFGFFGVVVYTRVQTPRRCGLPLSAGVLVFSTLSCRPLRTSCWIVGMSGLGLPVVSCGRVVLLRPPWSGVSPGHGPPADRAAEGGRWSAHHRAGARGTAQVALGTKDEDTEAVPVGQNRPVLLAGILASKGSTSLGPAPFPSGRSLGGSEEDGGVNFDSYTDRVVGVAAALVNALTPGEHGGRSVDAGDGRRVERCSTVLGRPVEAAEAGEPPGVAPRVRPIFLPPEDGA